MDERLTGNKVLSGNYGIVWLNNQKIIELKSIEVKVEAEREDVQLGLSVDSKIKALKGTGKIEVKKVYTRANEILKDWIKGKDTRARITTSLQDPDSVNGGEERVSIDNVWFNSLDIAKFTRGEVLGEEFPFGFTPEDVEFENEIK